MVCPFCGAVLPDDAVLCNVCGATRKVEKKLSKRSIWMPYLILGGLFAAGLTVYLLTTLL